jgi:cell division septation protein DedD
MARIIPAHEAAMADMDFDEFDHAYADGSRGSLRIGRLMNFAGAACSVALVIGMVVWGYKLAVRDVAGIPVIRALEGPLRIAPANPGGEVAPNQGLSVNAVAAAGTALPIPDQLVLAPPSAELGVEDVAGLTEVAPLDVTTAAPTDATDLVLAANAVLAPAEVAINADSDAQLPVTAALDLDTAPVPLTEQEAVEAALAAALADGSDATDPNSVPVLGEAAALRPLPRPASLTGEGTAASVVAPPTVSEVDVASLVSGTRLVQLGAFDDEATARDEWTNLQSRFVELLMGKSIVIQPAASGGRTFYRLRAAGFEGEDDSRRFCAALLAENASCIPVLQR